ncbi:MAG: lipid-A-disaccharide synthase [Bacteroidales bacterium]|nr:lipid-A-disaccharide synthase [Bacteroidales bacterium]
MKYYVIAGEASGDLHASNLMKELKIEDNQADFRCWGGDLMENQGGVLVKHFRDLAFMGFVEVVMNLRTILRNLNFCKKDILKYNPDVLILVDYPGFNLRIAEFAHKKGIKVFYYISPTIWAWKKSRVNKIKRDVDHMFTILPFEKDFYAQYNCQVDYPGNPLLDAIDYEWSKDAKQDFLNRNNIENRSLVALLPGSRKQEVTKMLSIMMQVSEHYKDHQFVIAGAPSLELEFYQSIIGNHPIKLLFGQTQDVLKYSDAALVTSGTATLEAAILGVPEALCYIGNPISIAIAKRLVKIKYIGLPNLIMDRPIIKEFIQEAVTVESLKQELDRLLFDVGYRQQQQLEYDLLRQKLGGKGASSRTARLMFKYLTN